MQINHALRNQASRRYRWMTFIVASGLLLAAASTAEAAWTATIKPDPLTRQPRCLLSSDPQITSDGYDSTPVTLVFNGGSLLVVTESELDASFADLQLTVDKESSIHSDQRDHKNMILVFDQDIPSLIRKLRAGKQATVYLRFWPTWPATQPFAVAFSLAGFSKAHDSLIQGCLPPSGTTLPSR